MKKLSGLLAMFLMSAGTNAAQQLSYSGHLLHHAADGSSIVGGAFYGQFTFNPESPDLGAYQTSPYPRIELTYSSNQSSSWTVEGGQPVIGNSKIELHFVDNFAIDQALIDQVGLHGAVQPGIYDAADISSAAWASIDSVSYYLLALFAADTFTGADIQNQNYRGILAQDLNPLFVGFRVQDTLGGQPDFVGAGVIENYSVAAVPLPGAAWLFGSALAGLALRLRKRM
ncbi:MAG: hypothetical protein LUQ11_07625 [Methylococcaceae bacterium]|nr:hypothetical protein [Methylococcaceae bacterium]